MQHRRQIEPRRLRGRRNAHHLRAGRAEFHGRGRFGEIRRHDPERRLARGMDQSAGAGQPQRAIQHHPHRRPRFHPRQAAGQNRIIRQHGADADQDGVALRAQQMHARLRRLARDRDRLVAGGADLVVGGDGELQDHMGALVADAAEMPGVIVGGFRGAQANIDRDPGRAKFGMPLPGHFRIGVFDRRHHARNAGGDHRIDARRRFAEMRTGLQRHIERGAPRRLTGPSQRLGLGMRPSAGLRPATADDDAVLDDDRADGRVRPGAPQPAPAERQRKLHEALVRRFGFFGFLRVLVFQNAEDHLRNVATRASSSAESSPSTASKSLASRKLR